ncbi:MAG: hypothetical protein K9L32_05810 [Chromatiaceae bacterium]|nr:hypothetical protein [Chromatiaceae bacterium]
MATLPTARHGDEPTDALSIALPSLDATERGWVADPGSIPVPARLGFGRVIPEDGLAAALSDPEYWQRTADGGQRLVLRVRSPEARALRLGLAVWALPDRASLRLFSAASDDLAPISGADIKASLERDRAALAVASAEAAEAEPLFWTPLLLGDSLTLELALPSGWSRERSIWTSCACRICSGCRSPCQVRATEGRMTAMWIWPVSMIRCSNASRGQRLSCSTRARMAAATLAPEPC